MKKVKIITIILAIVLITLVAFGGVYIQTKNRMDNKVKDYALGREIEGGRLIELKVSDTDSEEVEDNDATSSTEQDSTVDENNAVEQNNLTVENYEIVKKTIEKRLNLLGAEDYVIRLNEQDGTIRIELSENENTDIYAYYITASGKVEMKEKDTETELLNDSMIKKASYGYTVSTDGEYQIYLELQLNKEGQAKIQEISNDYAILSNEIDQIEQAQSEEETSTDENGETAEDTQTTENTENVENNENESEQTENAEESQKKIAVLSIGGTEYDVSKIEKNILTVNIGEASSSEKNVNNNTAIATELEMLINAGKMPIDYEISANRYVYSDITENQLMYFLIGFLAIILIILIILTIKYRISGLLSSISCIGFISLLSLLLRYTNVLLTIEGIGAILLIIAINLKINQLILSKVKILNMVDEAINNTYKDTFSKLIPLMLIALVFCFSGWTNLSSFGMVVFWGLILIAVYNITVTKALLKLKENK